MEVTVRNFLRSYLIQVNVKVRTIWEEGGTDNVYDFFRYICYVKI